MAKKTRKERPRVVASVAPSPEKKSNRVVLGIVLAALIVFTAVEVAVMFKINIRSNKKPVTLARWNPGSAYTGFTSMHVYGQNLYFVDSTRSTMTEYDVMTGKVLMSYKLEKGMNSMARLSNGDVLSISGGNVIVRFPSGSDKPVLPGKTVKDCITAGFLAVDSMDNVYVLDTSGKVLIKCDKELNKISEIGRGALTAPKRIYAGPGDAMYVIDILGPNKTMVKVFDAKGTKIRSFKVLNNQKNTGYESLAITEKGEVYINNVTGNSIMCYRQDGAFQGSFSTTSDGNITIKYPVGIAGGRDGFIFVPASQMAALQNIKY
jgi:outer membrane protein assembly factor BamB